MTIRNFKVNLTTKHLLNVAVSRDGRCICPFDHYTIAQNKLESISWQISRFEEESWKGLKEAVLIRFSRGM